MESAITASTGACGKPNRLSVVPAKVIEWAMVKAVAAATTGQPRCNSSTRATTNSR